MQDNGDFHYVHAGVEYFISEADNCMKRDSEKMLLDENSKLQRRLNNYEDRLHERLLEVANLSKQMTELHEVNESLLKKYEEIEDNIKDLERENRKLMTQNKNDKASIQMLMENIEELEISCTLYKAKIVEQTMDLNRKIKMKKMEKLQEVSPPASRRNSPVRDKSLENNCTELLEQLNQSQNKLMESQERTEFLEKCIQELRQKVKDLEDQLCYANNENHAHDKLNPTINDSACTCRINDLPSVYQELEEDDSFFININFTSDPPKPEINMYKDLVDKYEKLLDLHRVGIEDSKHRGIDSGYSTLNSFEEDNTEIRVQTKSKCTEFKYGLGTICVSGDVNEQILAAIEATIETYNCRNVSTQLSQQDEEATNKSTEISNLPNNKDRLITSTPEVKSKSKKKTKSKGNSSLFKEMMKENFKKEITPIKAVGDHKLIPQPKLIPLIRKPVEEMVLVPASKKSQKKKNNKQQLKPQLVGQAKWKVAPATKKSKASKTLNELRTLDSTFNNLRKTL